MLIDPAGFLCLNDEKEPHHRTAAAVSSAAGVGAPPNYFFAEYVALAHARGISRVQTIEFSDRMLNDASIEIVWVDEGLHRRAIELLQQRPDKYYSLCDAVSFVVMRERKIRESLTTDKHFEQEGFVRLLA